MPDFLTPQAIIAAGPIVLDTLVKHYLPPRGKEARNGPAKDNLMYEEVFVLMKTFLEIATKHPVAALQRFGLVRTPAPPTVALHRVVIPHHTLTQAADFLIEALGGEEMAYKIAGGSKWWQVRTGPGVEAEWIVMKKDWKEQKRNSDTKVEASKTAQAKPEATDGDAQNGEFRSEMDELRCMLYIHGGAYYWGSINTHRYTIWRHARKMHGRCFAVNYRKAPQYPFPCAIQDCLAAWLYLVNPPPDAKHKSVDPKNIVLAGDSAGGGLVWALLQILRDTPGLELPAGAVLISPWSDLTHSFPSILHNTPTDIIPPYSFIHVSPTNQNRAEKKKPSSLWPPPPPDLTAEMQNTLRSKVKEAVNKFRDDHHLRHNKDHGSPNPPESPSNNDRPSRPQKATSYVQQQTDLPSSLRSSSPNKRGPGPSRDEQKDLHPVTERDDEHAQPGPTGELSHNPSRANPANAFAGLKDRHNATPEEVRKTTLAQCETPMVLEIGDENVAINTQIQLYATNAQLCHPWVSPILGYMGGLPPLLIIAGNEEVLRDEIIFAAHKAANPDKYPLREDVKALLPSLRGIEEKHGPTNVHLQVYDGTCHDLVLFSMTRQARGVFRAIASFVRYVTPSAPGSLSISKLQGSRPSGQTSTGGGNTPELASPTSETPPFVTPETSLENLPNSGHVGSQADDAKTALNTTSVFDSPRTMSTSSAVGQIPQNGHPVPGVKSTRFNEALEILRKNQNTELDDATNAGSATAGPSIPAVPESSVDTKGDDAGPRFTEDPADQDSRALPGSAGHTGIYRKANPYTNHMIRERVAVDGTCRPLESEAELDAMTMPADEIGVIKEGPAMRFLTGQALWDKKFSHALKTVERHRKRNLKNATGRDAKKLGSFWDDKLEKERHRLSHLHMSGHHNGDHTDEGETGNSTETEEETNSGGSTPAVKTDGTASPSKNGLLDQSWSWSWALDGEAPPPSAIVSRRDFTEARQLALMADRIDETHQSPVHGLSIWVGLASFFSKSHDRSKAEEAIRAAKEATDAQEAARGTLPGEAPIGQATLVKGEKIVEKEVGVAKGAMRKMGHALGFGK